MATTTKRKATPSERVAAYHAHLVKSLSACKYCGGLHAGACPFVSEIEFEKGVVKRVVLRKEHLSRFAKEIVFGPEDIAEADVPAEFKS